MEYRINAYPFTYLEVTLNPGESITAEAGSFIYGMGNYEVKTKTGGITKGLFRKLLAGESLFLNTYIARTNTVIGLAPNLPGRIIPLMLNNEEWYLNDGAYLAHYGDIDVSIKFLGFKGLLTRWNLFWIKISGRGIAWITSYGEIIPINLAAGQEIVVDNSQLLAFPSYVKFDIMKFGGLKSFLFGGEGLVVRIRGPATVYIQTRSIDQLAWALYPYIKR